VHSEIDAFLKAEEPFLKKKSKLKIQSALLGFTINLLYLSQNILGEYKVTF
jgi:hypothetical protein